MVLYARAFARFTIVLCVLFGILLKYLKWFKLAQKLGSLACTKIIFLNSTDHTGFHTTWQFYQLYQLFTVLFPCQKGFNRPYSYKNTVDSSHQMMGAIRGDGRGALLFCRIFSHSLGSEQWAYEPPTPKKWNEWGRDWQGREAVSTATAGHQITQRAQGVVRELHTEEPLSFGGVPETLEGGMGAYRKIRLDREIPGKKCSYFPFQQQLRILLA